MSKFDKKSFLAEIKTSSLFAKMEDFITGELNEARDDYEAVTASEFTRGRIIALKDLLQTLRK